MRWFTFLVALGLAALWFEPALANKFETIGGGVSGSNYKKIQMLKMVSWYAGLFFTVASVGIFLGRKKLDVGYLAPAVVMLLAVGLIAFAKL